MKDFLVDDPALASGYVVRGARDARQAAERVCAIDRLVTADFRSATKSIVMRVERYTTELDATGLSLATREGYIELRLASAT